MFSPTDLSIPLRIHILIGNGVFRGGHGAMSKPLQPQRY